MSGLIRLITAEEPAFRDRSLDAVCAPLGANELLAECAALDDFRRNRENLYERVRALFFLYAIHRFHLPPKLPPPSRAARGGLIPFKGYEQLLQRRFEEAIDSFLTVQDSEGPSDSISSALAAAYHRLGFQTLAGPLPTFHQDRLFQK